MAWEDLRTDYTDASWTGSKKYEEIKNSDGTVSFNDVTEYVNRENSFFSAEDANSMNGGINTLMNDLEGDNVTIGDTVVDGGEINIGTQEIGGGTIKVGNSSGSKTISIQSQEKINIGNESTSNSITIGNSSQATRVSLNSTDEIAIGSDIANDNVTINIGNTSGAKTLNLQSGSGSINLQGNLNINTSSNTTNAINIGNSSVNTAFSLDSSGTINIANGVETGTVNIGNSSGSKILNIATNGSLNINSSTIGGTLNIGNSTGSGAINIGNSSKTGAVNIEGGAGNINIGTTKSATGSIKIGNSSSTRLVYIDSSDALNIGSSADTINIGWHSSALNLGASNITIDSILNPTINTEYNGISIGRDNSASGSKGIIEIGRNLSDNSSSIDYDAGVTVMGNYNNRNTDLSEDVLVVGNGYNMNDTTNGCNGLRLTGDGYLYYNTGCGAGADYAEFFEWSDGNSTGEDRIGVFVTPDFESAGGIKIAQEGDYILGVVSGNPSFVGNADEEWRKRWMYDDFGRPIYTMETVPVMEVKEVETGEYRTEIQYDEDDNEIEVQVPITELKEVETGEYKEEAVQVQNPDYDPTQKYESRFDRKEWDTAGLLGVLAVKDDGTCEVEKFCKCGKDGVATIADERAFDTYIVVERVADNIVKIIFK